MNKTAPVFPNTHTHKTKRKKLKIGEGVGVVERGGGEVGVVVGEDGGDRNEAAWLRSVWRSYWLHAVLALSTCLVMQRWDRLAGHRSALGYIDRSVK